MERRIRLCHPLTRPAACGALRNAETKAETTTECPTATFPRRINEGATQHSYRRASLSLSLSLSHSSLYDFANVLSGKLSWLYDVPFLSFVRVVDSSKTNFHAPVENNRAAMATDFFQRNPLFREMKLGWLCTSMHPVTIFLWCSSFVRRKPRETFVSITNRRKKKERKVHSVRKLSSSLEHVYKYRYVLPRWYCQTDTDEVHRVSYA